ncbi:thioredoxin domain-containing protein [Novosphingobium sp. EMRT-2]|uniref:DsbA family protein n=1 Tax=Novosphingobium sp. EMRT-2 TaxID=2571749 RepID=UPI0010BD432F|nr:thioredoxin domain-containing protein [Novosphingobium sp. EMRT-2]QCI94655.1 protein-disulfide isomerase [Novosphingobium sp. EMRT-2]
MKPTRARLLLLALPLVLGLSACGKKDEVGVGAEAAAPIAKIAPPAGKAWTDMISATPDGGYLMGNPQAPLKLIEFGALSCSHCAAFSKEGFPKLKDDYVASGRVSYELRLFMLNALDVPAALLATCGSPEAVIPLSEQFWDWQPNMFTNLQKDEARFKSLAEQPPAQRFAGIAQLGGMTDFFAARGIAADQASKCLSDTTKATELANRTDKATKDFNVTGTPTFVLNGKNLEVASWQELEPLLQKAGAR